MLWGRYYLDNKPSALSTFPYCFPGASTSIHWGFILDVWLLLRTSELHDGSDSKASLIPLYHSCFVIIFWSNILSSSNITGCDYFTKHKADSEMFEAKQSHSNTPPKSHLIIMRIVGIPVTWFWDCPPLLQAPCNLHSWREEVECPQAGAATSSQPPPCLALVFSLICSIATRSLPPEPGLTACKPVTVFFTTLNEIL